MIQEKRKLDFSELRQTFRPQIAMLEANRCLYCYDAPCVKGCPVSIDIPNFIQSIRSGNLKRAARIIDDSNPFGSVCGRVCPVERLCEEKCVLKAMGKPVQIGMLQRFASDYGDFIREPKPKNGKKVAVVGAGPAGLACASELARHGYEVTVFESKSRPGGMIAYGVPEYRCPHDVTAREVEKIVREGVEIRTSTPINRDVSELFSLGYEAIFIAIGLTKTSRPEIIGLNLQGVYMGLDFLNRIGAGDPPVVGRKVVTVGGGDTALDCARSALRLGAEESTILYRRSFVELPADKAEIEEALAEGIIFRTLTQPVSIIGDADGVLRAVECVSMKLDKPDHSGRRTPVVIKGSEYRIPANTLIFATGTEPSALVHKILPGAKFKKGKYIAVDPETMETSIPSVFAGGDVVNMGATVVQAVANGKAAAHGIMRFLEAEIEPIPEEAVPEEAPDVSEGAPILEPALAPELKLYKADETAIVLEKSEEIKEVLDAIASKAKEEEMQKTTEAIEETTFTQTPELQEASSKEQSEEIAETETGEGEQTSVELLEGEAAEESSGDEASHKEPSPQKDEKDAESIPN